MRGRFFAALLCTTCLTPVPASAGPAFGAFFSGLFASFGATATTAAVASALGGAAAAGFATGAFLTTTFAGKLLLGIGLSALTSAFAPKPNIPQPSEIMRNFAQPISYAQTVYGETRKGGPLGFTGAKDSRRYFVPILASHEIEGISQHWIDEWTVGLDPAVTDPDLPNFFTKSDSTQFTAADEAATRGRIEPFLGAAGQTASAALMDKFPEITEAHDFAGLAGAVIWASKVAGEQFSAVYPAGREWQYAPVVRGHNKIFDPRDGTQKYTNNAALIMAHWITEILGQPVDWDAVAIEADVADVVVTDVDGVERPKWTLNGTISDEEAFEAQRAQLAGACDAFLFERPDGKVGFLLGRWIEPSVTLTGADFLAVEITEGQWGASAPTEVSVQYTDPENAWREAVSGTWVEEEAAFQTRDEPQLFMVTNHDQAVRLAKRIAKARRPQYQLQGTLGLAGYNLIGQRFFRFANAALSIEADFEVSELRRVSPTTFEVTAVSSKAEDFDFDAATETPEKPKTNQVASAFVQAIVTGVTASAVGSGAIMVNWDAQPDFTAQEVRWKRQTEGLGEGAIEFPAQTAIGRPLDTAREITGLVDGKTYDVDVRNVNAGRNSDPGAYAPNPALQITVLQNTVAPTAITDLEAETSVSGLDIVVSFTAPNDPNYFGARIWRGPDSTFANAALVHTEFGIPSSGDAWTDEGLPLGDYVYWAAPINQSGVEGDLSGPVTASIT